MPGLVLARLTQPSRWPLYEVLASRGFALSVILPAIALLLGTVWFRLTDADLAISRQFYDAQQQQWPLLTVQPWDALYHYGTLPGMVVGIAGTVAGLLATVFGKWKTWGKSGVFLGLMLLLGPGLAVNGFFKPQWGRPRPNQVAEFGGEHQFLRVGDPGWNAELKSFPCGHASMGFYLIAPAFLCYRRHPRLAIAFLLLGLAAGGSLGVARVVQGRHFASDVLWSAGMVYYSGLAAYVLLGLWRPLPGWSTVPTPDPEQSAEVWPAVISIEQARAARTARDERQSSERRKSA
ncbi:MAG: phosphatase PAP2 family protein [Pirellulaceae bacterium]|nr:phosphatase PAP2 family protein [Pirellulaceae bacterium]